MKGPDWFENFGEGGEEDEEEKEEEEEEEKKKKKKLLFCGNSINIWYKVVKV